MQQDFDIELGTGKVDAPTGVGQTSGSPLSKQATGVTQAGDSAQGATPAGKKSMLDRLDITRSSHPIVCVFHMLFKLSAILV